MISVILNVYNGGKYVEQCAASVLAQTYQDFELLIVDDGSTDKTATIIDKLASNHSGIRVFHTENKGISGSRRYALRQVKGDYMISLDCDDWIEPTFLERLYTAIKEQKADLAICEYVEEREDGSHPISIQEQKNVAEYTRDLIHGRTWCVIWNKLVKTSIVRENGIDFLEGLRYWEDVPFSVSYSLYCNKIAWVHEPLYHYIKTNAGSLTATEGVNINFNTARVQSIQIIDEHLAKTEKEKLFEKDMLWIKFWIKDAFIRYDVDRERIKLWRASFPEVNTRWRENDGGFNFVHWALMNKHDSLVLLHHGYWQLRHKLKKLIKH